MYMDHESSHLHTSILSLREQHAAGISRKQQAAAKGEATGRQHESAVHSLQLFSVPVGASNSDQTSSMRLTYALCVSLNYSYLLPMQIYV